MSKLKPGTVEKNTLTTVYSLRPPAGIEPTPLRCRCNAFTVPQSATSVAQ